MEPMGAFAEVRLRARRVEGDGHIPLGERSGIKKQIEAGVLLLLNLWRIHEKETLRYQLGQVHVYLPPCKHQDAFA